MAKARRTVNHPWVQAATLCDQLVEDKTGAFSIIRIVDRFSVRRPPDWDGKQHLHIRLTGLLAFKSGDVKGKRTVRLFHTPPQGKKKKMFEQQVEFLGADVGVNMKLRISFGFKTEGTHWIDVYIGQWLATRMPLTVELLPTESPQAESTQGAKQSPRES